MLDSKLLSALRKVGGALAEAQDAIIHVNNTGAEKLAAVKKQINGFAAELTSEVETAEEVVKEMTSGVEEYVANRKQAETEPEESAPEEQPKPKRKAKAAG